jgi:hypothetical protein
MRHYKCLACCRLRSMTSDTLTYGGSVVNIPMGVVCIHLFA